MSVVRRISIVSGFILVLLAAMGGRSRGEDNMNAEAERVVHKAKGGGRWFPGTKRELETMVNDCISNAGVSMVEGRIVGVIAPHAGYVYSGKVAGYAFRAIRDNAAEGNKPDTVVVLGLSHHYSFRGVALMDGDALETPLGVAKLDKEAAEILMKGHSQIAFNYGPHEGEHSAENEIPFVQVALPGIKLVVGLVGDHDPATINSLVSALNELAKKKRILVVASSDMLHDPDYERVTKTDRGTLEDVRRMDDEAVLKSWDYTHQVFCGIGPVLAVMRFAEAQGCGNGTVLYYRNTGDDFPESRGQWVVGYGAVAFTALRGK